MAQLMPLPLTVSCFSKIQIGFTYTYLVPAHLGSPEKGPLNGCVCVCVCVCVWNRITGSLGRWVTKCDPVSCLVQTCAGEGAEQQEQGAGAADQLVDSSQTGEDEHDVGADEDAATQQATQRARPPTAQVRTDGVVELLRHVLRPCDHQRPTTVNTLSLYYTQSSAVASREDARKTTST